MAGGLDIGTLSGRVELEDNLSGKMDVLISKVDQFSGKFSDLGSGMLRNAASFFTAEAAIEAVKEAASLAIDVFKDMTMEGARIADVEDNFDKLTISAGQLGETLLSGLREGLHNTVTDFELMKTVNNNLASGLALTDQNYKDLAEGGFALAQAKGLDVKEAFEEINTAMFTGRTRQIQYLTGKIDLAGAEAVYAERLGTTADRLTSEQKIEAARVAILDKVREATARLGEQQEGLDEKVEQARTRWANFYEELSKSVATSPEVLQAFDNIQGAIADAFGGDQEERIKNITAEIGSLATTAASAFRTITEVASGTITVFQDYQGVIEAGVIAFGGYYTATLLASTGASILSGTLTGVKLLMAEVSVGTLAASAGLIGAAAALGAFIGYSLGKLQPISDFFQGLTLRVQGYSAAEVDAMIATDHANQAAIESGQAAQHEAAAAAAAAKEHADASTAAANAEKLKAEALAKTAEEQRLSASELKAYLDAWKDLNSMGETWQQTLSTIDQDTRTSAQYYLGLGASLKEVQSAFKLTDEQAKALAQDLKTQNEAVKLLDDLWTKFYQTQADLGATSEERANNQALAEYEAHVKALQDMGDDNVAHYDQLWTLYQKDVDQNQQSLIQKDQNSKASLDREIREQEQQLQRMLLNTDQYNGNQIRKQAEIVQSLQQQRAAWNSIGDAIDADSAKTNKMTQNVKTLSGEVMTLKEYEAKQLAGGSFTYDMSTKEGIAQYRKMNPAAEITWSDDQIMAYIKKGGNLQGLIATGVINPYAHMGGVPKFDEGGMGDFGSGTLAMLHGKEIITPVDKVGALGGNVVNNFYVNGTAASVARQISAEIMRTLKLTRQFGSQ